MKEGWKYKALDELCDIVGRIGFRGYTKQDLVSDSSKGAITLSPSNIIDGELDFSKSTYISWEKYEESPEIQLAEGDVVLVKTASIGKCAVVRKLPHKATLNPQFVVFKNLQLQSEFLTYYLKCNTTQKTITKLAGGVAIPTLSQKKLGTLHIPVPPLAEQQRIVEYLDAAFAKIDALKAKAKENLDNAQALFQAALTDAMTPKEGWEEKTLGEICTFSQGIQVDVNKQKVEPTKGSVRFLRIVDFTQGGQEPRYIDNPGERYMLHSNEIAMVRYGTVGFVCYGYEGIIANNLFKINIKDTDCIISHYLQYVLKSDIFQSFLKKGTGGVAMPAISFSSIKGIIIPFPHSIEEQENIASQIDIFHSKVTTIQQNFKVLSASCDALKQSLLRQVFE